VYEIITGVFMKITKRSPLTGKMNIVEMPVTDKQLADWTNGTLIHIAMPHLTADEREFLITGYTPDDWDWLFPEEEEE
jgi:hypothetical protein